MHKKLRAPAFAKTDVLLKAQFGSSHCTHTLLRKLTRYKAAAQVAHIHHLVLTASTQDTQTSLR